MHRANFSNLDIGSPQLAGSARPVETVKVGPALTSHNPPVAARAAFRDYTEFKQPIHK